MTEHIIIAKSDNSADVDFATIQDNVSGYFRNAIDRFTKSVKNHPKMAIAGSVAVAAGVVAATAGPIIRARNVN